MIIKKYKNRKLYNVTESKYVTLRELLELLVNDIEFRVICKETEKDLTNNILIDIVSHYNIELSSQTLTQLVSDIKTGVTV